jgi:hypothetical protein
MKLRRLVIIASCAFTAACFSNEPMAPPDSSPATLSELTATGLGQFVVIRSPDRLSVSQVLALTTREPNR